MKNVTGKLVRRLYLNQLVMSIFGVIVITSADIFMEGGALTILASLLAVGLYLFLIYDLMWNAGAKDAARRLNAADAQVEKIKTPLLITLFASLFNLAGAVLYAIFWSIIHADEAIAWMVTPGAEIQSAPVVIGDAIHVIMGFTNGMYIGFQQLLFPHPLGGMPQADLPEMIARYGDPPITELAAPWFYFLIPAPLIAAGVLAYWLGASEIKLSRLLPNLSAEE